MFSDFLIRRHLSAGWAMRMDIPLIRPFFVFFHFFLFVRMPVCPLGSSVCLSVRLVRSSVRITTTQIEQHKRNSVQPLGTLDCKIITANKRTGRKDRNSPLQDKPLYFIDRPQCSLPPSWECLRRMDYAWPGRGTGAPVASRSLLILISCHGDKGGE